MDDCFICFRVFYPPPPLPPECSGPSLCIFYRLVPNDGRCPGTAKSKARTNNNCLRFRTINLFFVCSCSVLWECGRTVVRVLTQPICIIRAGVMGSSHVRVSIPYSVGCSAELGLISIAITQNYEDPLPFVQIHTNRWLCLSGMSRVYR